MITLQDALNNGRGTWRSFHCPVHDDHNPSARVNSISGKWVCMSCRAKGKAEDYTPPEKSVFDRIRRLSDEEPTPIADSLCDLFTVSTYWQSRFSKKACEEFELFYDCERKQSLYTLRERSNTLLGFVYRDPNGSPKYHYPKGTLTSSMLYGINKITEDILFVCEGAPDVVGVWDAGFQAVGTFGSVLHSAQLRLIEALSPRRVVVAYDMDAAGLRGGSQAVTALRRAGFPTIRAEWDDYNDAADMPVETRREIFTEILDEGWSVC